MQTQRHTCVQTQTHMSANTETHMHRDLQAHRHTDTQTYKCTDLRAHRHRPTNTKTSRHADIDLNIYTDTQTEELIPPTVRFSLHLSTECLLREVIKHSRSKVTWPSRHMDVLMALSRETYNRRPMSPYPTQTNRSPTISRIMRPYFVDLPLHIRN